MNAFELIIFDWDGTLMDSTPSITYAIREAARDIGIAVPSEAEASHVIGLSLEDALRQALPDLTAAQVPALLERYRFHYLGCDAQMQLFPEVESMLGELRARGHFLAIATGKSRAALDRVLAKTGLAPYFDATRTADQCRSKPHPQMLLELTDHFGVAGPGSLMVGDTTHDLQMAKSAAVFALGVGYGAHPAVQLHQHGPLDVVHSSQDLRAWLVQHG